MDRHVILPPTLCNLTWIVTHKIATKICIPQQDLADDFDDDALKKFHTRKRIIVSSKWANCVEKWKRYVLRELLHDPERSTAWALELQPRCHFSIAILVTLRILQGLKITVSRSGETCVLNRHRSPYTHQNNHYTRSRSRSKSRSRTQSRERSRSRERYYSNM